MNRKLIEYLPPFLRDFKELKAITDAEQFSFEKMWTDEENVFADSFVEDATEGGIARYEKLLGIIPKGNQTLEERRFSVLARMSEQMPYTMETLENMLSSLCGEDGYTLRLDPSAYALSVKLALTNENNVQAVNDLLTKVVPANIITIVTLFNSYIELANKTHEQLGQYTHETIRKGNL